MREVQRWEDAPAALHAAYQRSRYIQSTVSVVTGTGAFVGGLLQLTGSSAAPGDSNTVVGALLLTGGASSLTVGALGLTRPLSDAELQAERLRDADDVELIEAWVRQRRTVARRNRIARAIGLGATAAGLAISAALLEDPTVGSSVAGFDAIAGEGANLTEARVALAVISAGTAGFALFTGLRKSPADRIVEQVTSNASPSAPLRIGFAPAGAGGSFTMAW